MTTVMYMAYDRIRELREDHDLRQVDVVKMLDMSQTGYSKYETGKNEVTTSVLIALAKHYDVSTDYIIELTDNPKPYSD